MSIDRWASIENSKCPILHMFKAMNDLNESLTKHFNTFNGSFQFKVVAQNLEISKVPWNTFSPENQLTSELCAREKPSSGNFHSEDSRFPLQRAKSVTPTAESMSVTSKVMVR